jgi:hypothetical protein
VEVRTSEPGVADAAARPGPATWMLGLMVVTTMNIRQTDPTGNKFSGQIAWVQIDIGDDSQDHLVKAEDRLTIAMARQ